MKLYSNTEHILASPEKVFNLLISITQNNQIPILPQVTNWTKLVDGCSFTIKNMINCSVRLTAQSPFNNVEYTISTDKNISAVAQFTIAENGSGCTLQIGVTADVPLLMEPMIKGPLEQGLNKGVLKIKEWAERI